MLSLDMGSGETFKNDWKLIKQAIDEIKEVLGEKKAYLKWQLFDNAKDGKKEITPLMPLMFEKAFDYAKEKGLMTTASVFDPNSLAYLLKFQVPFIKLANSIDYHYLSNYVPRGLPIHWSVASNIWYMYLHENYDNRPGKDIIMSCISKYPAEIKDYEESFIMRYNSQDGKITENLACLNAISDHTVGLDLIKKYHPLYIEKHFKLEGMNHCADCGDFAITPNQLKELVNL